jgi:hypothetical protein
MALTLSVALLCGMILEAQGLVTWAKRLEVGPLRNLALPVAERWESLIRPSGLVEPRLRVLEAKGDLAPWMLPRHDESQPTSANAEPVTSTFEPARINTNAGSVSVNKPKVTRRDSPPTERILVLSASEVSTIVSSPATPSATPDTQEPSSTSLTDQTPLSGRETAERAKTTPSHSPEAAATVTPVESTNPLASAESHAGTDGKVVLDVAHSLDVALAGDSMMAVGLAPTLTRGLSKEKNLHLIKAYRSGTGLARPEVFDWLQEYPHMLRDKNPDLVICSMGANDAQNVQLGTVMLEFGSAKWDEFYSDRLIRYLDLLSTRNARILWVGIPVMKEPRFARKMRHMNDLVKNVLERYPNVTWMDPNPSLGYINNVFAQYSTAQNGKPVKLRADDGIHMTDQGASFLLPYIRNWLGQTANAALPSTLRPPADTQEVASLKTN